MTNFRKIILIIAMVLTGLAGVACLTIGLSLFTISVSGLYIYFGILLMLFGLVFIYYTIYMVARLKTW